MVKAWWGTVFSVIYIFSGGNVAGEKCEWLVKFGHPPTTTSGGPKSEFHTLHTHTQSHTQNQHRVIHSNESIWAWHSCVRLIPKVFEQNGTPDKKAGEQGRGGSYHKVTAVCKAFTGIQECSVKVKVVGSNLVWLHMPHPILTQNDGTYPLPCHLYTSLAVFVDSPLPSPIPPCLPPSLHSLFVGSAARVLGFHDVRELWRAGECPHLQLLKHLIWRGEKERGLNNTAY